MRWHFLLSPPESGPRNMAVDEALMGVAARTGDAVFRVYAWAAPTLSFGRNQRARGAYADSAARAQGVAFVRRPTGGRALLHHREVTYSVAMPVDGPDEARRAYEFINEVLLAGLHRLGVGAERARDTKALPPGPRACFDVPAERELALGGRKLVGSAQWRHDGALLQHGSILVRDDQPLIGKLLVDETLLPTPQAATLHAALGRDPAPAELAELLRSALSEASHSAVGTLDADAIAVEAAAREAFYRDDAWTWRR